MGVGYFRFFLFVLKDFLCSVLKGVLGRVCVMFPDCLGESGGYFCFYECTLLNVRGFFLIV